MVSDAVAPGGYRLFRAPGINLPFTSEPGGAVDIAVGPAGHPWTVDSSNNIHYWDGTTFVLMPGKATDIAVGADGVVWKVSATPADHSGDFRVALWGPNHSWIPEPGRAVDIAVGPSGSPWIINSSHHIYHWTGATFVSVPGLGTDIAVDQNGQVWLLGTASFAPSGHQPFVRINSTWVPLSNGALGAVDLAVSEGRTADVSANDVLVWSAPVVRVRLATLLPIRAALHKESLRWRLLMCRP